MPNWNPIEISMERLSHPSVARKWLLKKDRLELGMQAYVDLMLSNEEYGGVLLWRSRRRDRKIHPPNVEQEKAIV